MEKVIVSVIGAVVGAFSTYVAFRIKGKRAVFRCIRSDEAFNKNDNPAVGYSLNFQWQGQELDNFMITRFRITNDSPKDFTNVPIRLWSGQDTMILQESINHGESLDPVGYAQDYLNQLVPDEGGEYTSEQINLFNQRREFQIGVWNRFNAVEIVCLSSCPIGGQKGGVWLEINQSGVKLIERSEADGGQKILNVYLSHIWVSLLFVLILSVALPILLLDNKIAVGVTIGVASTLCGYFAALFYHFKNWVRKFIGD